MILRGWKEIAKYLRCGVRTAQRWQPKGLPVRHMYSGPKAPMVADSEEIDLWVRGGSFWRKDMDTLANVQRSRELRAQVKQSRENLRHTVDELEKTLRPLQAKKHWEHPFKLLRHLEVAMKKHEKTKGTISFLRTEVEAARTFVDIAGHAKFKDKIARNIANARKACQAMHYFIDRTLLSEDEAAEISGKLATVENKLAALEVSVGEVSVGKDTEQAAD